MSTIVDTSPFDEASEMYWEWREFCLAVQDASDRWARASSEDAAAAFDEYRRVLDLEERVAVEYAALVQRLG